MDHQKSCFVMMPFSPDFQSVYEMVIRPVVQRSGLRCIRADEVSRPGEVPEQIREEIDKSEVCVADITGNNANVIYEVALAHERGKAVILISQRPEESAFDLRHMRMIEYSLAGEGPGELRKALQRTLSDTVQLGSPTDLLGEMLVPESVSSVPGSLVIAASPLPRRGRGRTKKLFKRLGRTGGDSLGIRSLLQSFGFIYGLDRLPELLDPNDFDDEILKEPMHLYCIAGPKSNRWTGQVLTHFNQIWAPTWRFRADPSSPGLTDVQAMMHKNDSKYVPDDYEGSDAFLWDFGLIIRGPNPFHEQYMVTILAGRGRLGTEAACRAATDPEHLGRIRDRLRAARPGHDLGNHKQAFYAVVHMTRDRETHEGDADTLQVSEAKCFRRREPEHIGRKKPAETGRTENETAHEEKSVEDQDGLSRLADLAVPTGTADLAMNIDHYLYGHPKVSDARQ